MERKYYEAYDDRFRQVHAQSLRWFDTAPSPILIQTVAALELTPAHKLLEIGCGEGRDAIALLDRGFDLLATDVSAEAIRFCTEQAPSYAQHFQVLDCVTGHTESHFDFIYAIAVIHMLVEDSDRAAFYRFITDHLAPGGKALICTMGDGTEERKSDIRTAFQLQDRIHAQTGTPVRIAGTSCRMVNFPTFQRELAENGLAICESGLTSVEPDFNEMMYALVTRNIA